MVCRILITGYERNLVDMLAAFLSLRGIETCTAYDGEQVLATARQWRPDVLLTDGILPGKDGKAAAAAIGEMQPECRILVAGEPAWRKDVEEQGFRFEVMDRPIAPEALLRQLREGEKPRQAA